MVAALEKTYRLRKAWFPCLCAEAHKVSLKGCAGKFLPDRPAK